MSVRAAVVVGALALAAATPANAAPLSPLARAAAREGFSVARAQSVVDALTEAGAGDWTPLLLAVAIRESSLLRKVETCERTGDGGLAVGLWQEHAGGERRDALCRGGMRAQARVAVRHLTRTCRGSAAERIACYAGRKPTDWIVRDRLALARRLAAGR